MALVVRQVGERHEQARMHRHGSVCPRLAFVDADVAGEAINAVPGQRQRLTLTASVEQEAHERAQPGSWLIRPSRPRTEKSGA